MHVPNEWEHKRAFVLEAIHALHLTAADLRDCNRRVSWPSSLGRSTYAHSLRCFTSHATSKRCQCAHDMGTCTLGLADSVWAGVSAFLRRRPDLALRRFRFWFGRILFVRAGPLSTRLARFGWRSVRDRSEWGSLRTVRR